MLTKSREGTDFNESGRTKLGVSLFRYGGYMRQGRGSGFITSSREEGTFKGPKNRWGNKAWEKQFGGKLQENSPYSRRKKKPGS